MGPCYLWILNVLSKYPTECSFAAIFRQQNPTQPVQKTYMVWRIVNNRNCNNPVPSTLDCSTTVPKPQVAPVRSWILRYCEGWYVRFLVMGYPQFLESSPEHRVHHTKIWNPVNVACLLDYLQQIVFDLPVIDETQVQILDETQVQISNSARNDSECKKGSAFSDFPIIQDCLSVASAASGSTPNTSARTTTDTAKLGHAVPLSTADSYPNKYTML